MMLFFLINDLVQASCVTLILFAGKLWTSLVKYRSSVERWTFLEPFTLNKYSYLHCICICIGILYSSWVERWSSLAPVSKFLPFLLTQECKKAKSQKLTEILKSIESAAQEVFVDVVYYHDVDNDDDYYDHLERRSRGFVAFLRPSVHPIQDEVNFTQFRMTWMSTLRQRSRKCRRSEIPTWIFLPSRMRLLSQALWRKVRPKRDTNRQLVNTLFKVNTISKSDNIKEFELTSSTARVTSHH